MTDPYIEHTQSWCFALRRLMGYPSYAPAFHSIAWCAGAPRDLAGAVQMSNIAVEMGRDLVHIAFALDASEPLGISLMVRQDIAMEWFPNVTLYAASETAKVELLAHDRRWTVGPRHVLTSAKLPPRSRRAVGEEIAMRRWRQAVATMKPLETTGGVWIGPGERFADAVPVEAIQVVA